MLLTLIQPLANITLDGPVSEVFVLRMRVMRGNAFSVALPFLLGLAVALGADSGFIEPASGQEKRALPDPTWTRLGLPERPTSDSGRGVGIVVLDDAALHPDLRPLGGRLRHVIVGPGGKVSLVEPLRDYKPSGGEKYTHGIETLLQMASPSFRVGDREYCGVAPGASYFVVPYAAGRRDEDGGAQRYDDRLDRALEWVVANRERWNIRVILLAIGIDYPFPPPGDSVWAGMLKDAKVYPHGRPSMTTVEEWWSGLLKSTDEYPLVRALRPAVEAGLLVVAGNGNTRTMVHLPPADYLAVGTYHDFGSAGPGARRENSDEPSGRNGDGHVRPDVLTPGYFVPNHRTAKGELAYFGKSSSGSAQVAALCAQLFARFPDSNAATIKQALILSGDSLPGSRRPGVCVNAARAIKALEDRSVGTPPFPRPPPIKIADPNLALGSGDDIERALGISVLALHPEQFQPKGEADLRRVFWRCFRDESPIVRMAASTALAAPRTPEERTQFWDAIRRESEMGVRGHLALLLLDGADADELDDWIALVADPNWTARWCAAKVLRDRWPEAPRLDYTFLPEDVARKAEPVLDWYRKLGRRSNTIGPDSRAADGVSRP